MTQLALVNIVISTGYLVFGGYLWKTYDEIGSRSLALFGLLWGINFILASLEVFIVAGYGVTSATQLAGLTVPPNVRTVLFVIAPLTEFFSVSAIYTWVWFVLNYTTRLDRQERLAIGALSIVLILIAAVNASVGVLTTFDYLTIPADIENAFHQFAGIVEIMGTGIAIGAGVAQLFRTSQRHPRFELGAVPALGASLVILYLTRYIYRLGLIPQFATIEWLRLGGHIVGVGGLWLAVHRYDLFDQLPASQAVGRDTAVDNVEVAIVLLNQQDNIADINPAGESLFDTTAAEVIGSPFSELLPASVDADVVKQPGETTFEFPDSDRTVQAETAMTTDDRGRQIGRTTVFNDITDERRRQQRIQVLNRVLRHNLRNDISVASGFLDAIVEGTVDADTYGPRIQQKLDGLVSLGSKAREIEEILGSDPTTEPPVELSSVVAEAITRVEENTDTENVTIVNSVETDVLTRANPRVLRSVLEQLIENSVEHSTEPEVEVSVDIQRRQLIVRDTGPGIPDHEIEVFDIGQETDLQHGSGLGLWLVKWGVDRLGATIEFDTETDGTRAVITVPESMLERS